MELKDFISVAGKSGLHTIVGKSKNNVIVESLKDKKRFPIFNTNKISGLSDISIYTYDEEILLSELFDRIQKKYKKEAAISHLESAEELKKVFEELVPNYDQEQVYNSDIKKVFQWYNILHDTDNLIKEESKEEKKESSDDADIKKEDSKKEAKKEVKTKK
ncbi:MAG: DUF5606 domain-containing protein [Bacteroidota bacterium]|nr:DUF5606 domain-containing protein [Bacteroidota bacterium]MEC8031460.1 DUF5606 domain-containing protein [Bacteroidota bacterium]MEC8606262.1 DUF5606 domain-containing protein [Bacteroidota bacterium]MED5302556.1 DUF5606 domain-containing protein [Bacteroidota bacterium]